MPALTLTMRKGARDRRQAPLVGAWLNLSKRALADAGALPKGVELSWLAEEVPVSMVSMVMN